MRAFRIVRTLTPRKRCQVGALDAFMSTWSNARATLGEGTPQEGAQFDRSNQLRQAQSGVESAAPGARWTGTAADSYADANSKQGRVLGQMAGLDQRLGAEVDRSAAVVAAGRQNLDGVKQWVLDAASTVPQGADREQALMPIARKGIGDVADVVKQTNSDLNAIGARIRTIGNEYQALGDDKNGKKDPKDGDPLSKLTGDKADDDKKAKEQAQKDVEAALSGNRDAADRVRRVLNTIGDDQLAGKKPLTPEQASYLSQMQAQQKGMSLDAIKRAGDNGAKDIMANSWQLMSNPNIQFPKTDLTHGALDNPNEMVKGGFAQLPQSVQGAIESKGMNSGEMQTIADIAHSGNQHFQTNTDFDRGMIHKASDMMNSPLWSEHGRDAAHVDGDRAVSTILSAVSPDHQVVHDALTGHVDNPNNDPYKAKFAIDGTKFMQNVTHEAWGDHGAGAGSLFDWTDKASTGPEAKIAAETAHAYSHYIGTHEQDLLHLSEDNTPGLSGHHTLGEVNPHLVQDMARGLTPYVNNIAGVSGGLADFGDVDAHKSNGHLDADTDIKNGTLPNAKGVFSVLNTDPNAAKIFDGAAYAQAVLDDKQFADHPGAVQPKELYDSATLRGLVDVGTHNAFQAFREDQYAIGMDEYQWKKSAYEFGMQGLGKIPGAGSELSFFGSAVESNILGTPQGAPTDHPVPMLSPDAAEHEILDAMVATGHRIDGLPNEYYAPPDQDHPYWRVRTSEEMQHYGIDDDTYSQVIGQASAQWLGPATYMEDRYNHVIHDSDPQK